MSTKWTVAAAAGAPSAVRTRSCTCGRSLAAAVGSGDAAVRATVASAARLAGACSTAPVAAREVGVGDRGPAASLVVAAWPHAAHRSRLRPTTMPSTIPTATRFWRGIAER